MESTGDSPKMDQNAENFLSERSKDILGFRLSHSKTYKN